MFSFFGGVLLVPFPSIQSIYSDHVHCVHGWSESKHDKERYTQKCSNFFILQHVSSNFEILCVCDVLFVVFSKLIYQSKANPFPRCVYLYRSKTAFNSQSSILCTYVKRRRWKKEPVRNQSSVHIWTVWKRKSKLNTENKRIFFWLNYLDYANGRMKCTGCHKFSSWRFICSFSIDSSAFYFLVHSL